MPKRGKSDTVKYSKTIKKEPLSDAETRGAEDVLARLVASAFAADHPELFQRSDIVDSTAEVLRASGEPAIMSLQPDVFPSAGGHLE
jgi:hypothetical protein